MKKNESTHWTQAHTEERAMAGASRVSLLNIKDLLVARVGLSLSVTYICDKSIQAL